MDVTRNVILDLLPLYLADEVSEDSRILVSKYLEVDMELAQVVKEKMTAGLLEDFPAPMSSDRELEVYREAKRLMFWRTVIGAGLVAFVIFAFIITVLIVGAVTVLQSSGGF
jgi:hypothetical protein